MKYYIMLVFVLVLKENEVKPLELTYRKTENVTLPVLDDIEMRETMPMKYPEFRLRVEEDLDNQPDSTNRRLTKSKDNFEHFLIDNAQALFDVDFTPSQDLRPSKRGNETIRDNRIEDKDDLYTMPSFEHNNMTQTELYRKTHTESMKTDVYNIDSVDKQPNRVDKSDGLYPKDGEVIIDTLDNTKDSGEVMIDPLDNSKDSGEVMIEPPDSKDYYLRKTENSVNFLSRTTVSFIKNSSNTCPLSTQSTFPTLLPEHVFKNLTIDDDFDIDTFFENRNSSILNPNRTSEANDSLDTSDDLETTMLPLIRKMHINDTNYKISCINCNNVFNSDCSYPKGKLLQAIGCPNKDDVCYALHTPHGIVDRGCWNDNKNMSTYVCSCNLCNNIPIKQLPFKFADKSLWKENVVNLFHERRMRDSIYKDISCLHCETKEDGMKSDPFYTLNCLQGKVQYVAKKKCSSGQVCAIKAVKEAEFMWRGCVDGPLYNFWMTTCNADVCNDEDLLSIYNDDF